METKKIEMLLRAIELKSLSKAAEEYLYTPSAMSHIADGIENELGIQILKRTHSGIEVNNGCAEVIEKLRAITDAESSLFAAAKKLRGSSALTIATYSSLAARLLSKATKRFRHMHPDIKISIIVVNSLSGILREKKADVIIGEDIYRCDGAWTELFTEPYLAVLPKRGSAMSAFRREDISGRVFIMPPDKAVEKYVRGSSPKDIISVHADDDSAIIGMAADGIGISILPRLSLATSADFVTALALDPPLFRTIGAVYEKDSVKAAVIKDFILCLSAE